LKTTAAKDIKDEHVLERNSFTIARKEVATGSYSKLFRAKQIQNESIVCKFIILDKCPQKYKQLLLSESLKVQRYVRSGGENGCAKHTNFCKVFHILPPIQRFTYLWTNANHYQLTQKWRHN
jgi:hypothetical protein